MRDDAAIPGRGLHARERGEAGAARDGPVRAGTGQPFRDRGAGAVSGVRPDASSLGTRGGTPRDGRLNRGITHGANGGAVGAVLRVALGAYTARGGRRLRSYS